MAILKNIYRQDLNLELKAPHQIFHINILLILLFSLQPLKIEGKNLLLWNAKRKIGKMVYLN